MVQEPQNRNPFHHTRRRIAEELTARLQRPIDPDVVFGGHEEVARLGRMMRCLFSDVIPARTIRELPVTRKGLSQNWIQRFLDTSAAH